MLTYQYFVDFQYFDNIKAHISPNDIRLDIFKIYTERAVGKCPRSNFYTPRKHRNSKQKSGNSFDGHPVYLKDPALKQSKILSFFQVFFIYVLSQFEFFLFSIYTLYSLFFHFLSILDVPYFQGRRPFQRSHMGHMDQAGKKVDEMSLFF